MKQKLPMTREEAAQKLRDLRNNSRTSLAWQKIPLYIREELEAIEAGLNVPLARPMPSAELRAAANAVRKMAGREEHPMDCKCEECKSL